MQITVLAPCEPAEVLSVQDSGKDRPGQWLNTQLLPLVRVSGQSSKGIAESEFQRTAKSYYLSIGKQLFLHE